MGGLAPDWSQRPGGSATTRPLVRHQASPVEREGDRPFPSPRPGPGLTKQRLGVRPHGPCGAILAPGCPQGCATLVTACLGLQAGCPAAGTRLVPNRLSH